MNPLSWLLSKWRDHQKNKKWREFYARLDRNAEGRFSKSQYQKDIKKVQQQEKKRK